MTIGVAFIFLSAGHTPAVEIAAEEKRDGSYTGCRGTAAVHIIGAMDAADARAIVANGILIGVVDAGVAASARLIIPGHTARADMSGPVMAGTLVGDGPQADVFHGQVFR